MEEQPNYEPSIAAGARPDEPRLKTLGVRLDEGLHAQLSVIAQLSGSTLADEIRGSIEALIAAAHNDPELVARAESVQAEMLSETEIHRPAISGFFGHVAFEEARGCRLRDSSRRGEKPAATAQRSVRDRSAKPENAGQNVTSRASGSGSATKRAPTTASVQKAKPRAAARPWAFRSPPTPGMLLHGIMSSIAE